MEQQIINQHIKAELKARIQDVINDYQSGKIESQVKKKLKRDSIADEIKEKHLETNILKFLRYRYIANYDWYDKIENNEIRERVIISDSTIRYDLTFLFLYLFVMISSYLIFGNTNFYFSGLYFGLVSSILGCILVNYISQQERIKIRTPIISIVARLIIIISITIHFISLFSTKEINFLESLLGAFVGFLGYHLTATAISRIIDPKAAY